MADVSVPQLSTADLVLSCSICQETLSAVYAFPNGSEGLSKGKNHTDRSITRLWLTECAHITCGKHLEGGGVPFYPEDQPPKAPCPLCSMSNRDQTAKTLYAIRGVAKGQYDENIPAEYLQVPPRQLSDQGNEALRFQFVSLLRFASKVHERLLITEKELNTWKERESSIVACLAAAEPLGRALQLARDRLAHLGGETAPIDEALHHASVLRSNSTVPKSKPSPSTTNSRGTPLGDCNPPAGSLLASGSAADLQNIRNNVLSQHNRDFLQTTQMDDYDDRRSPKRKRPDTHQDFAVQQPHGVIPNSMQQRRSSRDTMPPPPKRSHSSSWTDQSRSLLSRQNQHVGESPSGLCHYGPASLENDYDPSGDCLPSYTKTNGVFQDHSRGAFGRAPPTVPNVFGKRQFQDGEIDGNFGLSAPTRLKSDLSGISPNRLTLPPSTPSLVSRYPPHRVGISVNVRTGKPALPTPESLNSPFQRTSYRPTAPNHGPGASPFFSNRTLATTKVAPSPFIKRPSASMAQRTPVNHPAVNPPVLAPTSSRPSTFSWLTTPLRQGQHQHQNQSHHVYDTAMGQNGSGAYRQRGGHERTIYQQPSLNSFSFTAQPQIEDVEERRSSRAAFISHGRRAARR